MKKVLAIILGIGASSVVLGNDAAVDDWEQLAERATEATRAAAGANKKFASATAGVYAVLLQDKRMGDEIRSRLKNQFDLAKSSVPKQKSSETKSKTIDDVKTALQRPDPIAALAAIGRLVTHYPPNAEMSTLLNIEELVEAVRQVAKYCPNCFGTAKAKCTACNEGFHFETIRCKVSKCINGRITCSNCSGDEWMKCGECDGKGQVKGRIQHKAPGPLKPGNAVNLTCQKCVRPGNVHRGEIPCTSCNKGQIDCNKCKGKGTIEDKKKCRDCDSNNQGKCPACQGNGKRP